MEDRRCIICSDFVTADRSQMKRHVAIVHCEGTFSTLQCDVCHKKFYDFDHFQEHTRETPTCLTKCLLISPVPLNENLERAFISLVDQMMKPIRVNKSPVSSDASITSTGENCSRDNASSSSNVVQEQPTDRQNEFLPKKPLMDIEVGPPANSASPRIVSVMSLANHERFIDRPLMHDDVRTRNDIFRQGSEIAKPMDSIKSSTNQGADGAVNEMDKDGLEAVLQQESHGMSGRNENRPGIAVTVSDSRSIIKEETGNEAVQEQKRRCLDGRIVCSECNGSVSIMNISHAVDHLRTHLSEPLLHCGFCSFKSNYVYVIRSHLSKVHDTTSDHYVNTKGNRIEELMKMATRCFDRDLRAGSLKKDKQSLRPSCIGTDEQNTETDGSVDPQSPLMAGGSNQGGQKEPRVKLHVKDLYNHCSQIVRKRQRKNRVSCSICKSSIVIVDNGNWKPSLALVHARRHVAARPVFQCKLCSFETNDYASIRIHVRRKHQSASVQYTDTTADRVEELMDLVSRCFDHDTQEAKEDTEKRLCTYQRNPRYKICQSKQGGFSVTIRRINQGPRIGMRADIRKDKNACLSGLLRETMAGHQSSGKDRVIQHRSAFAKPRTKIITNRNPRRSRLPSHIKQAKSACWEKVKKFMKDGKLECQLCLKKITITSTTWKNPAEQKEAAYAHATKHMNICDLYECSTCHLGTKTKVGIYHHIRNFHRGGQIRFIDHTDRYYREVLKQCIDCFDLESDGETYELEATTSLGTEQDASRASDSRMENEKKLDQNRCPVPEPVDAAQDSKKWLCCDRCSFKSTFKMLFQLHQKRMHS